MTQTMLRSGTRTGRALLGALLALLLHAPTAAAGVLVVGPLGPGVDFQQISAAVTAAAEDDVILVRSGTYAGFTVTGKSVAVVEDTGADARVTGGIVVQGLAGGQVVVLRGLAEVVPLTDQGLRVLQCAGSVWVESCELRGSNGGGGLGFAEEGLLVQDSDDVVLVRTTSRGGGFSALPFNQGAQGLQADHSRLSAFECEFLGTAGGFHDDLGGHGGNGAGLGDSTLFAADCRFSGGNGGGADDDFDFFCECIICGVPGSGGSGVGANGGSLHLLGNALEPGQGGFTFSVKGCPNGPAGLPLFLLGGAMLSEFAGMPRGLRITSPLREGQAGQIVAFGALGSVGASGTLLVPLTVPDMPAGLDALGVHLQAHFGLAGAEQLSNPTHLMLLDAAY